jgi:hypothetical protein
MAVVVVNDNAVEFGAHESWLMSGPAPGYRHVLVASLPAAPGLLEECLGRGINLRRSRRCS